MQRAGCGPRGGANTRVSLGTLCRQIRSRDGLPGIGSHREFCLHGYSPLYHRRLIPALRTARFMTLVPVLTMLPLLASIKSGIDDDDDDDDDDGCLLYTSDAADES